MFWNYVKTGLKYFGIGFAFFVIFLMMTFPFQRLGPKVSGLIEMALQNFSGSQVSCTLTGFGYHFPFGASWDTLTCTDSFKGPILVLKSSTLTLLPGYQSLNANLEKGSLHLKANAGFKSPPSQVSGTIENLSLKELSPFISAMISRAQPAVRNIQLDGAVFGKFEIPLKDYVTKAGAIDLEFRNFKLPTQSTLDLIGLKELPFKKAVLKANISAGKLSFSDVSFLSDHLSGKVEGNVELNPEFSKSAPNFTLKWSVQRSDALLSSPFGQILANAPCPNRDSEGFCNRRISRMEDLRF